MLLSSLPMRGFFQCPPQAPLVARMSEKSIDARLLESSLASGLVSPRFAKEREEGEYEVHIERRKKEPFEAFQDLKNSLIDKIERKIKEIKKKKEKKRKIEA